MYEHHKILDKIERLVDQLPYNWAKIEIELSAETIVLEKSKQASIGFLQEA